MRTQIRIWLLILGCLLFFISTLQGQRGLIVRPRNLAELSTDAETIVVARVVASQVEPHPTYKNLSSVVVTVSISETWKGAPKRTISYRQFLWDPRDIANHGGYRSGDTLLLFLNRTSEAGFTSPVGIEQGRFQLRHATDGTWLAFNGSLKVLRQGLTSNAATQKLSLRAAQRLLSPQNPDDGIPLDVLKESVKVYTQRGVAQ